MSVGAVEVLPAAFCEEGTITERPSVEYLWSDLVARRSALGLQVDVVAPLLGVDLKRYRSYETGGRALLGLGLVNELIGMEAFVASEADAVLDGAPASGTVVLRAVADQDAFTARFPQARTGQHRRPFPVSLQHAAVGRAAAELRRRGRDVEVYRGEKFFDLAAARLAVGLSRKDTPDLLGLNKASYNRAEQGAQPGGLATMKDLQALEDFVTAAAARFEVRPIDGVNVLWVLDDLNEFEKTYPEARFERSGTPYPVRMLLVAAGRRIHTYDVAGPALIAAD